MPDYYQLSAWAAHPMLDDPSDFVPKGYQFGAKTLPEVDVFFVHPTSFTQKTEDWNAEVNNSGINQKTDQGSILFQASTFNVLGRVYAPRYRQAHLRSYIHMDSGGKEALDLAYSDVERAFLFFIEFESKGRPFILASHSQGTTHLMRLIKEHLDHTLLKNRLVAAYLVGMRVNQDEFDEIPPCKSEGDTGCYLSWMTFRKGTLPVFYDDKFDLHAVHNPINWTSNLDSSGFSKRKIHNGILMPDFRIRFPHSIVAKTSKGMLWIKKPRVWYGWLLGRKNWHIADYNLFWNHVRANALLRSSNYLKQDFPDNTHH